MFNVLFIDLLLLFQAQLIYSSPEVLALKKVKAKQKHVILQVIQTVANVNSNLLVFKEQHWSQSPADETLLRLHLPPGLVEEYLR